MSNVDLSNLLNHVQMYGYLLEPARSDHPVESMTEFDVAHLWKYVGTLKPFIIFMGLPYTPFGPCAHLNQIMDPAAQERS
eukprot:7609341-Lingulodinium_polyedra.AAC.1